MYPNPNIFSQNKHEIDSLQKVFSTAKSDTAKIRIRHELYIVKNDIKYVIKNIKVAKQINDQEALALSYKDFGRYYFFSNKMDLAFFYLSKAITIAKRKNTKSNKIILASAYRYIGYIYKPSDPMFAKKYYEKSLVISKEIKDKIAESYALSAIGNYYEGMRIDSNTYKKALTYYLQSLEIREKIGSPDELAASLNETSRIYNWLGQFDKASKMKFRGLEIAEKYNDVENIIYLCNSIGNDYVFYIKDYKKALFYELKAYNLCLKRIGSADKLHDISKMIAMSYSKLGDHVNADKYYQLCMKYGDSARININKYDYNLSSIKHNLEQQLEKQKLLVKDAEIAKQKSEAKRQSIIKNTFLVGLIFLIILVIYILKSYREKQKINQELDLKNQKIHSVYALVEQQKQKVEKNNTTLTKLLNDKEILFKEVHHRVKNNLQIISSLLNLQSNTIADEKIVEVLKQSQSRINTMAILHNKLYQTEDFTNVPIDAYIHQMTASISESFSTNTSQIHFKIDADPTVELNIDVAIPFGLILNELTTNAFKHAFKGKEKGLIEIVLTKIETDRYTFLFRDNGNGLPDDYRENAANSLGLELIEMLVQQLNGTLTIRNDGGACFEILFVCE